MTIKASCQGLFLVEPKFNPHVSKSKKTYFTKIMKAPWRSKRTENYLVERNQSTLTYAISSSRTDCLLNEFKSYIVLHTKWLQISSQSLYKEIFSVYFVMSSWDAKLSKTLMISLPNQPRSVLKVIFLWPMSKGLFRQVYHPHQEVQHPRLFHVKRRKWW